MHESRFWRWKAKEPVYIDYYVGYLYSYPPYSTLERWPVGIKRGSQPPSWLSEPGLLVFILLHLALCPGKGICRAVQHASELSGFCLHYTHGEPWKEAVVRLPWTGCVPLQQIIAPVKWSLLYLTLSLSWAFWTWGWWQFHYCWTQVSAHSLSLPYPLLHLCN